MFFIVLVALVVLVGVPAGFLFYEPPTCFDGKKNGDEGGIDCGGSCELLCPSGSLSIIPKGDPRVIEVAPGFYEIVAVVENPNATAAIDRARYSLKLYEQGAITPFEVIEAETFIPRSSTFAIFEGPFNFGESRPVRAVLEWNPQTLVWRKDDTAKPGLAVRNVVLTGEDAEPRISATLVTSALEPSRNVELVALISDEGGNIIAASKTVADSVSRGEEVPIIFTWPSPFAKGNVGIDILWRVLPDRSYIR